MFRHLIPHPRAQSTFALLSLADLLLTWLLLRRPEADAYEANPLARWCLLSLGWAGLAAYKASTVAVVFVVVFILSRSRPSASAGLLWFGCAVVGAVVVYSAVLCYPRHGRCRPDLAAIARESDEVNRAWDERDRPRREYHHLLHHLSAELAGGNVTLAEAVRQLERTRFVQDPAWRRRVAEWRPGRSPRQHLALAVCFHALAWQRMRGRPVGLLVNNVRPDLSALGLEESEMSN